MWFIAHPWMTLLLGILVLLIIGNAIINVCKTISNIKRFELIKNFTNNGYTKEEIMDVFGKETDI